jgi:hypothetical protein
LTAIDEETGEPQYADKNGEETAVPELTVAE